MKIGCIFKTLFLIIVLIGIISYIYKQYGNEIIETGKDQIKVFVEEKIQNSIDDITDNIKKDSLEKSLNKLIEEIDAKNISINSNEYDQLLEKFNEIIDSNKIDFKNIEDLQKLIKEYEPAKKN